MIYRKLPPVPPRLLLRVVATAGAGALLGIAACGGTSFMGSIVQPETDRDASEDDVMVGTGSIDPIRIRSGWSPILAPGTCAARWSSRPMRATAEKTRRLTPQKTTVPSTPRLPDGSPPPMPPKTCTARGLGVCGVIVHPEE